MTTPAPVPVTRTDLGIIDGLHTWEVRNADTGEIIGYDQTVPDDTDARPDA